MTLIDHSRPLPPEVIERAAATNEITYQAHGAQAVGDNRPIESEEA